MPSVPLWTPSDDLIADANITAFQRAVEERWGNEFSDYPALHDFSLAEPKKFWVSVRDFCNARAENWGDRVLDDGDRMPGAKFFPDATLNFAENLLRRRDDTPAIIFRAEDKVRRQLSWRELYDSVSVLAQALKAMGVGRGDRVACLSQRPIECLLLTLAACRLGAVCLPANWRLASEELAYILGHGQAVFLMVDAVFVPAVPRERLPALRVSVCTEGECGGLEGLASWVAPHAPLRETVHVDPDDDALQLYSSGTTGLPKGVVLTHRGLLSTCETVARDWRFGADDVNGNPLPTFHVAGMTMLLLTLWAGGQTVAFPSFEAGEFIAAVEREGITHAFLVPAMLLFMLQQPGVRAADYRKLRLIAYGGSPISDALLKEAMAVFGCDFLQVYGMTEV